MDKTKVLFRYEISALFQSRWFWVYLGVFNLVIFALRYFSNSTQQLFLSIFNVILYYHFASLLLFATLAWQNNSKFTSLIMTQPVSRTQVFFARFGAFVLGVTATTAISVMGQLFFYFNKEELFRFLFAQMALQIIFTGIGFFLAIKIQDHLKSMATAMALILTFALILDGLNIWIIINYNRYPLENLMFFLSVLNPLTLVKFQTLGMDQSSLWIGYAGLVLQRAWKSNFIQGMSFITLLFWVFLPVVLAWKTFLRKDF